MNKDTNNHIGTDTESIEDVLKIIEKSYNIKFETNELGYIRTFGELTDHIISKIKLPDNNDCTSQQAFYKLRNTMMTLKTFDFSFITPNQELASLFPRQTREKKIKEIETQLGFSLEALRPRYIISITLLVLVLASIGMFFIDWKYAISGIVLSGLLFRISEKTGIEFKDKTMAQLTERMTQRNYLASRRNKGTMNKREVEQKIKDLFVDELLIKKEELNRQTIII